MKNDIITDAQDHITEAAVALSATNLVDRGSVLVVVRSGILRHTLPVAIAQRPVALNQDVKAVRPNGNVRSEYLALALKAFEREILHTCTKAGTTVQSVELPTFFRFQVPLPPLTEQVRIIGEAERQLSVVKELDVVVSANLQRATRLRQSILQRAFTGALVQ
jgi:type I restriction enzyme S subunit